MDILRKLFGRKTMNVLVPDLDRLVKMIDAEIAVRNKELKSTLSKGDRAYVYGAKKALSEIRGKILGLAEEQEFLDKVSKLVQKEIDECWELYKSSKNPTEAQPRAGAKMALGTVYNYVRQLLYEAGEGKISD
jgi:hypothetical protein